MKYRMIYLVFTYWRKSLRTPTNLQNARTCKSRSTDKRHVLDLIPVMCVKINKILLPQIFRMMDDQNHIQIQFKFVWRTVIIINFTSCPVREAISSLCFFASSRVPAAMSEISFSCDSLSLDICT